MTLATVTNSSYASMIDLVSSQTTSTSTSRHPHLMPPKRIESHQKHTWGLAEFSFSSDGYLYYYRLVLGLLMAQAVDCDVCLGLELRVLSHNLSNTCCRNLMAPSQQQPNHFLCKALNAKLAAQTSRLEIQRANRVLFCDRFIRFCAAGRSTTPTPTIRN